MEFADALKLIQVWRGELVHTAYHPFKRILRSMMIHETQCFIRATCTNFEIPFYWSWTIQGVKCYILFGTVRSRKDAVLILGRNRVTFCSVIWCTGKTTIEIGNHIDHQVKICGIKQVLGGNPYHYFHQCTLLLFCLPFFYLTISRLKNIDVLWSTEMLQVRRDISWHSKFLLHKFKVKMIIQLKIEDYKFLLLIKPFR